MNSEDSTPKYKDEDTVKVKVKRKKPAESNPFPVLLSSIEEFAQYFDSQSEPEHKITNVLIREVPSDDIANKFIQLSTLPAEMKELDIILLRPDLKDPNDLHLILKSLSEKKSDLEGLKLTVYDVERSLQDVDFSVLRGLTKLKSLKINLGMNTLEPETQERVLVAYQGHAELAKIGLILNNCGLTDSFLAKLNEKWFEEADLQNSVQALRLNFAQNPFLFDMGFDPVALRKFFHGFQRIETLKLSFAWVETVEKALKAMEKILDGVLQGMLSLARLKLNFFYCHLKHENVEMLCESLVKRNEMLDLDLDLREPIETMPGLGTIRAIEGLISFYRAVTNPRKHHVYY